MNDTTIVGAIPGTPTSWVVVVAGLTAVLLYFLARQWGWGIGNDTVVDHYVPGTGTDAGAPAQRFELTAVERTIAGVRTHGEDVMFGASGSQWMSSLVNVSASLVVLGLALAVSANGLLIAALVVASIGACAAAIALRRVEVRVSQIGIAVRGRTGGRRTIPWSDLLGVEIEVHDMGGPWQLSASPTFAQGVLRLTVHERVALPGFRSRQWFPERRRDPLTSADAKVAIIVRYRRSVA